MNYTDITDDHLQKSPPPQESVGFDQAGFAAGRDGKHHWIAGHFSLENGKAFVVHGTPTQWLEMASIMYGLAARALELQQAQMKRVDIGLDLLPRA